MFLVVYISPYVNLCSTVCLCIAHRASYVDLHSFQSRPNATFTSTLKLVILGNLIRFAQTNEYIKKIFSYLLDYKYKTSTRTWRSLHAI